MADKKQTLGFEAEVKQLLKLVINSLYSHKEIFLRELISNAADACDKLRFEALSDKKLYENEPDPKIEISFDQDAKTLTVEDNGIGMDQKEVTENIGTIARSGTKAFLDALGKDEKQDANLIGQFGVGFYSAFIVADKVTLETRRAGLAADQAVRWESKGEGEYTIEQIEKPRRGTKVILHLRDDEHEFLDDFKLRTLIHKYSEHLSLPIMMPAVETDEPEDKKDKKQTKKDKWEQVNKATALWQLPRNNIKDEEYKEFYKTVAHDWQDPLKWLHNKIEGALEYTQLLYIPSHAPFDLYERERAHGVKLYVKRVFIMEDTEKLMPNYLRFVRGVIDSNDLPLNVSREILQSSKVVNQISKGSTKKVLGLLEQMAKDDTETYQKFWGEFGQVLKEGIVEDAANQEQIAGLLRFSSTNDNKPEQTVSLADYVERMGKKQDKIYYITAESFNAASNSPHLEMFKQNKIEVLLLTDRIDEWVVNHLNEFDGKQLQSVTQADIDLADKEDKEDKKKDKKKSDKKDSKLLQKIKKELKEKVEDVKASKRLTDSPACLVAPSGSMDANMERILKSMGQEVPESKRILEINLEHPLIRKLDTAKDDEFSELSLFLLEQSILAEGGKLDDPASFTKRMNKLLLGS